MAGKDRPVMEEEAEYRRQLDLFTRSSTEKQIELVKLGEVLAGITNRDAFLDIGAGGGYLTIPLSQSFEKTVIVEPNGKQGDFLRRRCPEFTVHHDTWGNIDLGGTFFDFILCSHVLYYIDSDAWLPALEKMYGRLAPGGRIAVVLQSPIGEVAAFFNQFTRYDVDILGLWRDLYMRYGDDAVGVRYFLNEIWTESLEDMVDIGLFLLIDRRFRACRDEIRLYIEANQRVPGGFRMMQDEILLSLRKPG